MNPYSMKADLYAARAQVRAADAAWTARMARCNAENQPDRPALLWVAAMAQRDAADLAKKARKLAGLGV